MFCGLCVEACPCDAIRMDSGKHPKPVYTKEEGTFGRNSLLEISGRDENENWIDRSYLYTDWVLFTTALTALEEKVEGAQHAAR